MSVTAISRKMPENDGRHSFLSFIYVLQTKGCLKNDTYTHTYPPTQQYSSVSRIKNRITDQNDLYTV